MGIDLAPYVDAHVAAPGAALWCLLYSYLNNEAPPSTKSVTPVIASAASEQRKTLAFWRPVQQSATCRAGFLPLGLYERTQGPIGSCRLAIPGVDHAGSHHRLLECPKALIF